MALKSVGKDVRRRELLFARNLDWNLLKMFHEICQARGLTEAARELSRKQPAISLALRRLEAQLGVILCRRGPKGFELTDEGQVLAETCFHLIERVRGIPEGLAGHKTDVKVHVRVRLVSNLAAAALDEAIAKFHHKYPGVELIVEVAAWTDIVSALLQHRIDVGIAPARTHRTELQYHRLFSEVHRPYCNASHRFFGRTDLQPSDLREEAFVLTGSDEGDELTSFRLRHGLGQLVAGISDHLEEASRLARLGLGICFLPERFAELDVKSGRLWPLLSGDDVPKTDIYIITDPSSAHHAARHMFIQELRAAADSSATP